MDKSKGSVLLPFLFSLLVWPVLALPRVSVNADLNILRVPSDYPTIQEAIDSASPGSMILVSSGTYHENLVVNKTLELVGTDRTDTIIDAGKGLPAINVTADDVLINGFTLQNSSVRGICLEYSNNCTVSGNIITHSFLEGIVLDHSNCTAILGNIVSFSGGFVPGLIWGTDISLSYSCNNTISDNIITNSIETGIGASYSNNNLIQENVIEDNPFGIGLDSSNANVIYHNSFINNRIQVDQSHSQNDWDDGLRGNYWDDYTGLDDGSDGRMAGDGVGDTGLPYLGVDNYPLVCPPKPIPIMWENTAYPVKLVSSSTVSRFRFVPAEKKITFTVTGLPGTTGHFNLTIPTTLLSGNPWRILLDSADVLSQSVVTSNQTCTSIYVAYNHTGTYEVQIIGTWVIPEFSTHTMLFLTMFLALISLVVYVNVSRRQPRRSRRQNRAPAEAMEHAFSASTKKAVRAGKWT
jgi:parallel beta-helix repeat protein